MWLAAEAVRNAMSRMFLDTRHRARRNTICMRVSLHDCYSHPEEEPKTFSLRDRFVVGSSAYGEEEQPVS